MNSEDFIKKIIGNGIVKTNLESYNEIFENTPIESVTDDYWRRLLNFYNLQNTQDKELIFEIIKQIQIDTLSSLFSFLDGNAFIEKNQEDFKLIYGSELLNGDLQDIFLSLDEDGELF